MHWQGKSVQFEKVAFVPAKITFNQWLTRQNPSASGLPLTLNKP